MSVSSGALLPLLCMCMALARAASTPESFVSKAADDCTAGVERCETETGAEQVLLQKTQTRLASTSGHSESRAKDAQGFVSDKPHASFMDSGMTTAAEAPLNEEGYKSIANLKDEREMAHFIKRVADQHGLEIADEGSLNGVVPYYSGKKATQSFVALTAELSRTSKQHKGWARMARHGSSIAAGQVLLQESHETIAKPHSSTIVKPKQSSQGAPSKPSDVHSMGLLKIKAADVPMNEEGYKMIAELKDDQEMSLFVKRVADELGYEISDVGSLNGVVPYYSGKKATQSFMALKSEFSRTAKQAKGWAKKAGSKANDKKSPQIGKIEKKDDKMKLVLDSSSKVPKAKTHETKLPKKKAATDLDV